MVDEELARGFAEGMFPQQPELIYSRFRKPTFTSFIGPELDSPGALSFVITITPMTQRHRHQHAIHSILLFTITTYHAIIMTLWYMPHMFSYLFPC
jgi:hypothetical protein